MQLCANCPLRRHCDAIGANPEALEPEEYRMLQILELDAHLNGLLEDLLAGTMVLTRVIVIVDGSPKSRLLGLIERQMTVLRRRRLPRGLRFSHRWSLPLGEGDLAAHP